MAINGPSPTMLTAINSLQFATVTPGSNQTLALHLGQGKDYTIRIDESGNVSVKRDLAHLSTLERVKNAVVDFFSRAATNGESAFTTRATQIQSVVQQQLPERVSIEKIVHPPEIELGSVEEMVREAFDWPQDKFENVAQYLNSGAAIKTATMADLRSANTNRLGLEQMSDADRGFALENFPAFINGKEAIFSKISDWYVEKINALNNVTERTKALMGDEAGQDFINNSIFALGLMTNEFRDKVNAEFNSSFVHLSEQRAAADELQANTSANRISPQVEERTGPSDGENPAAKMKKSVSFNDNLSDVRVFELEEGRALNIKV
ncbi:hypothetical protein [Aeromonas salmonicida]|uniref:hypothetical protein n=1 Tax=Aeromonas salmonicida TaxID=645 RepID=UPI00232F7A36|nr:hypothetical protein [Aeromonas salmonicida]WCH23631.1 hypothetical protein ONZ54_04525 [Aeromonas salmonicida]